MDKKQIINGQQHNCSHCGTKGANYDNINLVSFDETKNKKLHVIFIRCKCCGNISMHLVKNLPDYVRNFSLRHGSESSKSWYDGNSTHYLYNEDIDSLDDNIILSVPTPTFIIDAEIPKELRELLIEALKCVKENALTGASACVRKAIYTFLSKEKAVGNNYDEKIKSIKDKWSNLTDYLDVLIGIKGMTSDQCHEDSFQAFNSDEVKKYVSILEEIFREIYVIPNQRERRKNEIMNKFGQVKQEKDAGKK